MGYYDEALSLCRSLGEIANLFAFFFAAKDNFRKWVLADRRERLREFSPEKIRVAIDLNSKLPLPVSRQQYRELCELATHVVPTTRPNQFEQHAAVGPKVQSAGKEKFLSTMSEVLPYIGMMGAKMTGNDSAFDQMSALLDVGDDQPTTPLATPLPLR